MVEVPSAPTVTPRSKKSSRLSKLFYISIFVDILCVALVVPQMAHHMSLLSQDRSNISDKTSSSSSTASDRKAHSHSQGGNAALFGLIQATYGIMQILSTPIMGALSDTLGKKTCLLMSVFGTGIAYAILAVALIEHSMVLFFVSRALVGAIRQTISIASAYVSEVYGQLAEEEEAKCEDEESVVDEDSGNKKRIDNLNYNSGHKKDQTSTTDGKAEKGELGKPFLQTSETPSNLSARPSSSLSSPIPSHAPPPNLVAKVSEGMSYLHASASLGFMVGPLLGGYIAHHYGDITPCLLSFGLDTTNALILYITLPSTGFTSGSSGEKRERKRKHPSTEAAGTQKGAFEDEDASEQGSDANQKLESKKPSVNHQKKPKPNPIRFIIDVICGRAHPSSRRLLVAMYLFSMASIALHSSLSSIGKEIFNATPLQAGAMVSFSSGLGALFLIFLMPRIVRILTNRTIVVSTAAISCLLYFGQLLAPSLLSFAIFEVLVSVSNAANGAANKAKFSTLFPPDRSGEAFAVVFSLDGINRVILPIFAGVLVQMLTDRANERIVIVNSGNSLTTTTPPSVTPTGSGLVAESVPVASSTPSTPSSFSTQGQEAALSENENHNKYTGNSNRDVGSTSFTTAKIVAEWCVHSSKAFLAQVSRLIKPVKEAVADQLIGVVGACSRLACISSEVSKDFSRRGWFTELEQPKEVAKSGEDDNASAPFILQFLNAVTEKWPFTMLTPTFWKTSADLTDELSSSLERPNAEANTRKIHALCASMRVRGRLTPGKAIESSDTAHCPTVGIVGESVLSSTASPSATPNCNFNPEETLAEKIVRSFSEVFFWDESHLSGSIDTRINLSSARRDAMVAEIALEQRQRTSLILTVCLSILALFAMGAV